jgi:hypothetical protein
LGFLLLKEEFDDQDEGGTGGSLSNLSSSKIKGKN